MRKNKYLRLDYSILSSYLGRFTTVLIFSGIVVLAIGAVFLENNDMAHIPITVGVCSFDSVRAADVLKSLSDFALERGYGDVNWIFIDGNQLSGCDFYLMTSVQYLPYMRKGDYGCSLIATNRGNNVYSAGAILVKGRQLNSPGQIDSCIFTSPVSASGFVSPYSALRNFHSGKEMKIIIEFGGGYLDIQRVAFSVIFGNYQACGLSLDSYEYLINQGIIKKDELEILLTGQAYPDLVLVSDPTVDDLLVDRFSKSFPEAIRIADSSLKDRLHSIGISGFITPRKRDFELLKKLSESSDSTVNKHYMPE